MKVLNYENIDTTILPTREVCQMIRLLTGEVFSKEIPIRVIDKGRKEDEYYKVVTEITRCDAQGKPCGETCIRMEVRKFERTPLRLEQGKRKVSLWWDDVDTFMFDDARETAREKRLSEKKVVSDKDNEIERLKKEIQKTQELLKELGVL